MSTLRHASAWAAIFFPLHTCNAYPGVLAALIRFWLWKTKMTVTSELLVGLSSSEADRHRQNGCWNQELMLRPFVALEQQIALLRSVYCEWNHDENPGTVPSTTHLMVSKSITCPLADGAWVSFPRYP